MREVQLRVGARKQLLTVAPSQPRSDVAVLTPRTLSAVRKPVLVLRALTEAV